MASEFLKRKAEEQAKKLNKEYGTTVKNANSKQKEATSALKSPPAKSGGEGGKASDFLRRKAANNTSAKTANSASTKETTKDNKGLWDKYGKTESSTSTVKSANSPDAAKFVENLGNKVFDASDNMKRFSSSPAIKNSVANNEGKSEVGTSPVKFTDLVEQDKYSGYLDEYREKYGLKETDSVKGNADINGTLKFTDVATEDKKSIDIPSIRKFQTDFEDSYKKKKAEQQVIDEYNTREINKRKYAYLSRMTEEERNNYLSEETYYNNMGTPEDIRFTMRKYGLNPAEFDWDDLVEWAENNGFSLEYGEGNEKYFVPQPHSTQSDLKKNELEMLRTFNAQKSSSEYAKQHPTLASVGTVLTAPVREITSAINVAGDTIDVISGKGINPYKESKIGTHTTNSIRETVDKEYASKWFGGSSGKLGNYGSLLYNGLMSLGDMGTTAFVGGGVGKLASLNPAKAQNIANWTTSILLASGSAENTIIDAKKRGLSDIQALALGLATGATEILTEKVSLDAILGNPSGIIKGALKGFIAEGSEEMTAETLNTITDMIIAGDESRFSQSVKNYINDGYTYEDAVNMTVSDNLFNVLSAGVVGGFTGSVLGGISGKASKGNNTSVDVKPTFNNENENKMDLTSKSDADTDTDTLPTINDIKSSPYINDTPQNNEIVNNTNPEGDAVLSLSPSKRARLENIIRDLGDANINKLAGDKNIRISTDTFSVNKAIYSKKGRTAREVNARIKAIPDFETIIRNSEYSHTNTDIVGLDKAEKKNVLAMHYFKTTYNGYDVEIVVRDKGEKQFLYEVKFIENKKNSQQSMPNDIGSTAPKGDVGNNNNIPQINGVVNNYDMPNAENDALENELNFARENASGIEENENDSRKMKLAKRVMRALNERFGINFKIYSGSEDSFINGFYENGTVYINENAEKPMLSVIGHEFLHGFKEFDSEGFSLLKSRTESDLSLKDYNRYKNNLLNDYKENGIDISKLSEPELNDKILEEAMSDMMGEFINDPETIRKIALEDKGLAERIMAYLGEFIDKIRSLFPENDAEIQSLVHNYEQLKAVYQEVVAQSDGKFDGSTTYNGVLTSMQESDIINSSYQNNSESSDLNNGVRYSFTSHEKKLLSSLDELKGKPGILYNNGNTIIIPNTDMAVLRHTYATEEHYSNRSNDLIDCISCSGRKDTKHYFYVFYKGEGGTVSPIFRLDYSYLDQHIDQVRKISKELGYARDEFINGTQGIRSKFVAIQSKRGNSRADVDAANDSERNRQPDRLLSVKRGGSSEGISEEPRFRELAHSGISDGQYKGEWDRDSEGRGDVKTDITNEVENNKIEDGDKPSSLNAQEVKLSVRKGSRAEKAQTAKNLENESNLEYNEDVNNPLNSGIYTEQQYRDYGWARDNDILTSGQNADYRSKFAMAKSGQAKFPKSKNGECIIPVSEIYDSSLEGINNVLVFAKGTIDKPIITSVIEIFASDETNIDKIRRRIYELERRGIQQKAGDLFGRYDAADFGMQYERYVLQVGRDSYDDELRGRSGGETSPIAERPKVNDSPEDGDKPSSLNASDVKLSIRRGSRAEKAQNAMAIYEDTGNVADLPSRSWAKEFDRASRNTEKMLENKIATLEFEKRYAKTDEQKARLDKVLEELRRKQAENVANVKISGELIGKIEGSIDRNYNLADIIDDLRDIDKGLKIKGGNYRFNDFYRNFERVFGKHFDKIKPLIDSFDEALGNEARYRTEKLSEEYLYITKELGIKKGSKESKAVQWIAEGERNPDVKNQSDIEALEKLGITDIKNLDPGIRVPYTESMLRAEFGEMADNILKAEQWYRKQYDEMINAINETQRKIYPNRPEKLLPKRKDYMRHFREVKTGLGGLLDLMKTDNQIAPGLVSVSEHTSPKEKWTSIKQERKGKATSEGAIEGFNEYISQASYAIYINPYIEKFRGLARDLAELKSAGSAIGVNAEGNKDITDKPSASYEREVRRGKRSDSSRTLGETGKRRTLNKEDGDEPSFSMEKTSSATQIRQVDNPDLNGFIEYLNDFANDLAGKTGGLDRAVIKSMGASGRTVIKALQWFNNRTKANAVLGNIASMSKQIMNIPNGIAYLENPANILRGVIDTGMGFIKKDSEIRKAYKKSNFLTSRYADKAFDKFEAKSANKFFATILGGADEFGTRAVWNALYYEAVKNGEADPIRYADVNTRKAVAGRGIGEIPLAYKSQLAKLALPFQIEPTNTWNVLRDMITQNTEKGKLANFGNKTMKIAVFYLMTFGMNFALEALTGGKGSFDPIGDLIEGMIQGWKEEEDEEKTLTKLGTGAKRTAQNIAGDFIGNRSFGWVVGELLDSIDEDWATNFFNDSLYQSQGVNIPALQSLTKVGKKAKDGDLVGAGVELATSFALPFGGKQADKTFRGITDFARGGNYESNIYKEWSTGERGDMYYPIEKTPANFAKSAIFGPSSLKANNDYWENKKLEGYKKNENKKLEEKETNDFIKAYKKENPNSEVVRLYNEIKRKEVFPFEPIKGTGSYTHNKVKREYTLTDEQSEHYQKVQNELMQKKYNEVFKSTDYKYADAEMKKILLEDARKEAVSEVKQKIKSDHLYRKGVFK